MGMTYRRKRWIMTTRRCSNTAATTRKVGTARLCSRAHARAHHRAGLHVSALCCAGAGAAAQDVADGAGRVTGYRAIAGDRIDVSCSRAQCVGGLSWHRSVAVQLATGSDLTVGRGLHRIPPHGGMIGLRRHRQLRLDERRGPYTDLRNEHAGGASCSGRAPRPLCSVCYERQQRCV